VEPGEAARAWHHLRRLGSASAPKRLENEDERCPDLHAPFSGTQSTRGWVYPRKVGTSRSLPLFWRLPMKKGGMPAIKARAQEGLSYVADDISW